MQVLTNIKLQIDELLHAEKKAPIATLYDNIVKFENLKENSKYYNEYEMYSGYGVKNLKDKFECLLKIIKEQNNRIIELEKKVAIFSKPKIPTNYNMLYFF